MASFLKKLVDTRHRSKSPQKCVKSRCVVNNSHPRQYYNGTYSRETSQDAYHKDYIYPPVCYLPLPPSPISPPRNSSRLSNQHSNQSNESVGIHSWNTERSDPPRIEQCKEHMKGKINDGQWIEYHKGKDAEDQFFLNKDHTLNNEEPILFEDNEVISRARSHSPKKAKKPLEEKPTSRSKSPHKKRQVTNSLDYLNSQCHLEGCSISVVVHTTRFRVCRHQLCHASEYFKNLLITHRRHDDIYVAVSGILHPSPTTQFRWFIESSIPCPVLKDISDDTLETCMRLSKRFQANGLEVRCSKFIIENVCNRQPIVALCWLNWCLKHRFDSQVQQSCLPCVARLALTSLEQHRHMMSERVFAEILAAKLRGCYEKAVHVFHTIHRMDHFSLDLERCPRCGRTKEGMRVKVNADPCRKQLGCDRCYKDGCEIETKAGEDLQAFFQCAHALLPLNDTTDECPCQTRSLASHLGAAYPSRQTEDWSNGYRLHEKSPDKKKK